jgi:anaerobic selenocysteine-containing dehydrogenase
MNSDVSGTFRTMCPMNCHPTLCGMLVEVTDGRVTRVKGDPDNPDSRGFLCTRGHASREIIGNPERVLVPLVRDGRGDSPWRETSWDEALDRIAATIQAVGPSAVGLWTGHGLAASNYGTRISSYLSRRFANLSGAQWWSGTMICWGLGAYGLGLTGALEVSAKEDMSAHSELIVMWAANVASQPNTARHVAAARARGAHVITIDIRETESSRHSDESIVLRPGTDAALALAMMHVIIDEELFDRHFVDGYTVGFDALAAHVKTHSPAWAAPTTGIDAERIVALARRYASTKPAMIVLGGSSMYKGANGWQGGRAIGCLPALTGNLGVPGGGFGPRHGASAHGQALNSELLAMERRPPGDDIPNQMPRITEAMLDGRLRAMLLLGTNMLSSYADATAVAAGLARQDLVVGYDLFFNDTARRYADVMLPATAWLEELGCKSTNSHLYLMPRILEAPGQARPVSFLLRGLAERLDITDFWPWPDDAGPIDAILDHPSTGRATVADLASEGGIRALDVSPVAHPDRTFATPSGKIEFFSERAASIGFPALPVHDDLPASPYALTLRQGRTLTHFHAFYDHGRALPTLAKADPEPELWIAPADAHARAIVDGTPIRVHNERGDMRARAHVTARIPPGTVWMRDGWEGINRLTSGAAVIPDHAVDLFGFSGGQAAFDARVEVEPLAALPDAR